MNETLKYWAEIAVIALAGIVLGAFGLVAVVGVMAAVLAGMGAVMGALFGGVAGGAYVAFKWIVMLAGWWL